MLARVAYTVAQVESAQPASTLHVTGALREILISTFDRWKAGQISDVRIIIGHTPIEPPAVEAMFDALRMIESRT